MPLLANTQINIRAQIGSRRSNVVILVPLEKVLVKFGTVAQEPDSKFDLNSGVKIQVVLVPVEVITILVPTLRERI